LPYRNLDLSFKRLYQVALQVWFYPTAVKIVKCGTADGKVGDSVPYSLVVWDFKEVVPGGRCFHTQVALSCQVVARTFANRELPVSTCLNILHQYNTYAFSCVDSQLRNYRDDCRRTVLLRVSTHEPLLTWGPCIDFRVVREIIGKKLQFYFY
jgi:hypothetical protein